MSEKNRRPLRTPQPRINIRTRRPYAKRPCAHGVPGGCAVVCGECGEACSRHIKMIAPACAQFEPSSDGG